MRLGQRNRSAQRLLPDGVGGEGVVLTATGVQAAVGSHCEEGIGRDGPRAVGVLIVIW